MLTRWNGAAAEAVSVPFLQCEIEFRPVTPSLVTLPVTSSLRRAETAVLGGEKFFEIFGRLAQLVRALCSHRRGHWFESSNAHSVSAPPNSVGLKRFLAMFCIFSLFRPIEPISCRRFVLGSLGIEYNLWANFGTQRGLLWTNFLPLSATQ
jgi:hypothetical protein